jgi:hypothetical protein
VGQDRAYILSIKINKETKKVDEENDEILDCFKFNFRKRINSKSSNEPGPAKIVNEEIQPEIQFLTFCSFLGYMMKLHLLRRG